MNYELIFTNPSPTSTRIHPYSSVLSSSASSSTSSVFSVEATSSKTSDSSHSTNVINLTWPVEDQWRPPRQEEAPRTVRHVLPPLKIEEPQAAAESRQNARRRSVSSCRGPPSLIRQSERKGQFVDCLVEAATLMVEVIWPLSVPSCRVEGRNGVLPLRTFIQETLRRSRTSFSTLQVALYYLILIKDHVGKVDFTMEQPADCSWVRALQCGRRMFLAALILASKYLQDRNYSARAWSKISGLTVCEINTNEMAFLHAVDWKLHVPGPLFDRWQDVLIKYTNQQPPSPEAPILFGWRSVVSMLTPGLERFAGVCDNLTPPQWPHSYRSVPSSTSVIDLSSPVDTVSLPLSVGPPRVLEPTPTMLPPTPSLARMGPLPTPILTPQSAISNTPAASYPGCGFRRPSLCSSTARVQREAFGRTTTDCRWLVRRCTPPEEGLSRRPSSLSDSSLSSPESMVSDTSSQNSRTSSVSSASSVSAFPLAPVPVKLGRLATLQNARQTYALPLQQAPALQMPPKEAVGSVAIEPLSAEPMSSPDFASFRISDSETPHAFEREESLPRASSRSDENANNKSNNRKRCRPTSVDLTLQHNVRRLLEAAQYTSCIAESPKSVLSDERPATSFLLGDVSNGQPTLLPLVPGTGALAPKALQSPPARSAGTERRMPVQKCCGRKRACCARPRGNSFENRAGMTPRDAVMASLREHLQQRRPEVWVP